MALIFEKIAERENVHLPEGGATVRKNDKDGALEVSRVLRRKQEVVNDGVFGLLRVDQRRMEKAWVESISNASKKK